jgi:hypothetical protein
VRNPASSLSVVPDHLFQFHEHWPDQNAVLAGIADGKSKKTAIMGNKGDKKSYNNPIHGISPRGRATKITIHC